MIGDTSSRRKTHQWPFQICFQWSKESLVTARDNSTEVLQKTNSNKNINLSKCLFMTFFINSSSEILPLLKNDVPFLIEVLDTKAVITNFKHIWIKNRPSLIQTFYRIELRTKEKTTHRSPTIQLKIWLHANSKKWLLIMFLM